MRLNTLTENQRLVLLAALSAFNGNRRYALTPEEREDVDYLMAQLKSGKGTQ
jgi:hypothetical protein